MQDDFLDCVFVFVEPAFKILTYKHDLKKSTTKIENPIFEIKNVNSKSVFSHIMPNPDTQVVFLTSDHVCILKNTKHNNSKFRNRDILFLKSDSEPFQQFPGQLI